MKKLITIILALVMFIPVVSLADLPDVTAMSDQELKDLISAASAELMARNASDPEGTLLFEYEGARIYQTGNAEINFMGYLQIPVAVYNDMDIGISFGTDAVTCNGWDIYGSSAGATAKAKKKDTLTFKVDDAEITSLDQIDSLRFKWTVTNTETYMYIYKQEESEEHRFW